MNGWAIPLASPDEDPDVADVENVFRLLEEEIVPRFYEVDSRGIPVAWVQTMKHAIKVALERFTAGRMVRQYVTDFYEPSRRLELPDDDPPSA
jgi:starch phosphorylase